MDIAKIVARIRLVYHSNMLSVVNAANQMHLLSDDNADMKNINHLKECFDCLERLDYKLPKECKDFKDGR
jgi:hypothetical protein